jgi:hypothetical protein
MMKKLLKILMFSVCHAIITFSVYGWTFTSGIRGGVSPIADKFLTLLTLPLLLPVFYIEQDLSNWVILSFWINSIIWGLIITLLIEKIKEEKQNKKDALNSDSLSQKISSKFYIKMKKILNIILNITVFIISLFSFAFLYAQYGTPNASFRSLMVFLGNNAKKLNGKEKEIYTLATNAGNSISTLMFYTAIPVYVFVFTYSFTSIYKIIRNLNKGVSANSDTAIAESE